MKRLSILIIIFGLLFAFLFQANRVQLSQIPGESIRIDLGSEEDRRYLLSGWSGDQRWEETTILWARGRESILRIPPLRKENYRLTIKAFSSSPPGFPNQVVEIWLNNLALDRWELEKSTQWQKFRLTLPSQLISKETNTLRLIYSEETPLFPVAFDYIKFKNYFARLHRGLTLYILYDPVKFLAPGLVEEAYSPPLFIRLFFEPATKEVSRHFDFKVIIYFIGFVLFFLALWLLSPWALSCKRKIELSRVRKLDLLTYLPSLFFLLFLALFSFFSRYHIVYSHGTFFILALVPTLVLKTWFIYRDVIIEKSLLLLQLIISTIKRPGPAISKISLAIRRCGFQNIKNQVKNFRAFLIAYHKKDRSSALILDFILLIFLGSLLLIIPGVIMEKLAEWVANIAYLLLLIGLIMKIVQVRKGKE